MHSLIAVMDMTRASDLIRSRTFDAFFPLLVTVRTPHLIPSDALDIEDNMLAAAILRSVSTDIHIEKNALIITVR